jgi:type III secretion system FlhB-like substrate exporter
MKKSNKTVSIKKNPDLNTLVSEITIGQLIEVIKQAEQFKVIAPPPVPDKYEYGVKGIGKIFKVSRTTACKIKASGKIAGAIIQNGRTIVIDIEKAIELFGK